MSRRHLSCPGCRIRVRANVPEIELLEGMCPICDTRLQLASFASGVMGFRLFDLGPLSDRGLSGAPHAGGGCRGVSLSLEDVRFNDPLVRL
jgi:hypothetical protein